MVKIDTKDLMKLERRLGAIRRTAIPYAERAAVNGMAFEGRANSVASIQRNFTLRNRWTVSGLRVDKATAGKPYAEMGSLRPYMETQELGGSKRRKGKHGVPIPTSFAAGMGLKRRPRTRPVRKINYMTNIRLPGGRRHGKNQKQANAIAARKAAPYAYFKTTRAEGIFKIQGRKAKMVYDLSRPSVDITRRPWLRPAVASIQAETHFYKALQFQLKRLR